MFRSGSDASVRSAPQSIDLRCSAPLKGAPDVPSTKPTGTYNVARNLQFFQNGPGGGPKIVEGVIEGDDDERPRAVRSGFKMGDRIGQAADLCILTELTQLMPKCSDRHVDGRLDPRTNEVVAEDGNTAAVTRNKRLHQAHRFARRTRQPLHDDASDGCCVWRRQMRRFGRTGAPLVRGARAMARTDSSAGMTSARWRAMMPKF